MEWDDDGLDDEPGSPLLPPDDRLWRHPSEVAATSPTRSRHARVASSSGPPRVVTVVALTSCISVLFTLGLVAVVRPFRAGVDPRSATPTGGLDSVGDVAELTARLRPAIGQVRAIGGAADGGDSTGSGVMIRRDGMMLTSNHVVEGATSVVVRLDDGRQLDARMVGGDTDTDIAVLDVDGDAFPVAPLATRLSGVGEPAVTIGAAAAGDAPGPLVRVTMVSAVGQEASVDGRRLVDMIRTDSAMATGSSGGAVVDRRGQVVAIASANVDRGDGPVGFATPIPVAAAVAEQLMKAGKVVRVWLGIEGASREGALVQRVMPGSPAAVAGLSPGDLITAVDGGRVSSISALVSRLRDRRPGDAVRLSVARGASTIEVSATLVEKPA